MFSRSCCHYGTKVDIDSEHQRHTPSILSIDTIQRESFECNWNLEVERHLLLCYWTISTLQDLIFSNVHIRSFPYNNSQVQYLLGSVINFRGLFHAEVYGSLKFKVMRRASVMLMWRFVALRCRIVKGKYYLQTALHVAWNVLFR